MKANTHGPEYSWHKYWSRKPANVISAYLSEMVPHGGLVVDPFSGSGVVLREATKLGLDVQAFDINPSAVAISSFMVSSLSSEDFTLAANRILDIVEEELGWLYKHENKTIRFLVHHVVTDCSTCGAENVFDKTFHGALGKRCQGCGARISFGLASMRRTVVTEINYVDRTVSSSELDLEEQYVVSERGGPKNSVFDLPFVENRRTLTSTGFTTRSFFTPRNFWILSRVAELAHEAIDGELRNALLLLVTGSSAQASRLIASRGKLAGGGQAWTVPGFWVPPIHLESNPFVHLRARVKKLASALESFENSPVAKGSGSICQLSAEDGLKKLASSGTLADLIFLDPPYGDSVAFLEFSAIWNSFLGSKIHYGADISVSDRVQEPMSLRTYQVKLQEVCERVAAALKPTGKVLLTFNNQDLNAWKAILTSLQRARFKVAFVAYQDPAVVSSKSQLSKEGSYLGDFYVGLQKYDGQPVSFESIEGEMERLITNVAAVRGGSVAKPLVFRFALQRWLSLNADAEEISALEGLMNKVFNAEGKRLTLKNREMEFQSIETTVQRLALSLDLSDSKQLSYFATLLRTELNDFGAPSLSEAFTMISDRKSTFDSESV